MHQGVIARQIACRQTIVYIRRLIEWRAAPEVAGKPLPLWAAPESAPLPPMRLRLAPFRAALSAGVFLSVASSGPADMHALFVR